MSSNFLYPCITERTRLIRKQKPGLIDNMFVNFFNKKLISGNLFEKISDHLPSFVVIKDINNKQTNKQTNKQSENSKSGNEKSQSGQIP